MINKQGAAQLALGQELMKKGDKKLKGTNQRQPVKENSSELNL